MTGCNTVEHSEALGVEQRRIRAGLWRIEGWYVGRHKNREGKEADAWAIARREVDLRDGYETLVGTLREAREWIRTHERPTAPDTTRK
jgi:hypothetical protein